MRQRSHGILVALLLLQQRHAHPGGAPRASTPATGGFWQLTDVHVDLLKSCSGTEEQGWYGSFEGMYGCGCSVETVNATAEFMRATAPAPDFILFTGDATASGAIIDNIEVIQGSVEQRFPATPIFLVLGNHDFPGSPVGPAAVAWYRQVADTWGSRWLEAEAQAEFSRLGYYSTTPPGVGMRGVRLIALNTELFNHGNDFVVVGETVTEAFAHLEWLNATLADVKAKGQRAYILGHVPIGMETAYGNDRRVPSVLRPYWMDLFARRYQDILDSFGEATIAVQLFGHEHVDTFRLLGKKTVALTAPSMSTAYPRTNPTVRYWHQTVGGGHPAAVNDYDQYIMDLLESNAAHRPIWKHTYSFRSEYGLPDLSRSSFETLLARFNAQAHPAEAGWLCADERSQDSIYVPGRSLSHVDTGFNATKTDCSQTCKGTPGCRFWQWGHTFPDFEPPNAWCYILKACGALVKDEGSAEYRPKYQVWPEGSDGSGSPLHNASTNDTSYARERRFFLSSTSLEIQPACDGWCQMQDLCDKQLSGSVGSDMCFTECLENNGRALGPVKADEAVADGLLARGRY